MLSPALLLCVLSAAPKVAVTRFSVIDLSEARADFYTEHFADRLHDQGVDVVTPGEVQALLGLERQKQLLGCDESSSCLAEITSALGVDAIALGTIARVGGSFQLNVKIISARDGKRLAGDSAKVDSESALLERVTNAALTMAPELSTSLHRPLRTSGSKTSSGSRKWWWLPGTVGVLAAAGGAAGLIVAENTRVQLATGSFERSQGDALLSSGQTARTLGWIGVGVGAVALGAAVGLLAFGSDGEVVPMATLSGDGAIVGLAGRFP